MIKNHLKIAWRTIKANKTYATINIAGLSLGLASCLLVSTVVLNDLSYDTQWSKADEIYRLLSTNIQTGERNTFTPTFLVPEMINDFPEVKAGANIFAFETVLKLGQEGGKLKVNSIFGTTDIWDVLDFKILQGNPKTFAEGYTNIVITKSFKDVHYPNTNPIGKEILDNSLYENLNKCMITGIIDDLPSNTHLKADVLVLEKPRVETFESSKNVGSQTQQYVVLKKGTSAVALTAKVNDWYARKIGALNDGRAVGNSFSLQPIKDIYLNSDDLRQTVKGSLINVKILSGVALLLLLIACINYINLSTARTTKRVKETGMRKVLGAGRNTLVVQYLIESVMFFALALFGGIFIYYLGLPVLERFIGHSLDLNVLGNASLFAAMLVVIALVSLLTGIYPAYLLSKPKPAIILFNNYKVSSKTEFFRKTLVVLQFTITIGIIVSALVVDQQLNYINQKDLGFNKNNLLSLDFTFWSDKGQAFKNALKNIPGIESVSIAPWVPGSTSGGNGTMTIKDPQDENKNIEITNISADPDFGKTLQLKLIKGSFPFSANAKKENEEKEEDGEKNAYTKQENSNARQVVITEYTAERLGVTHINKPIVGLSYITTGIVENFNNESLRNPLKPTVISIEKAPKYGNLLIRLNQNRSAVVLEAIQKEYNKFYPNDRFGYTWVDENISKEFRAEKKLQMILKVFSLLVVFLSVLGLFGLITFMIQGRTKEISIRKVLGASTLRLVTLLSKGSVQLVFLAILIALPISYYAVNQWLMGFPYRIELNFWVFVLGALIALGMALITVGLKTLKAAQQNPADNLKND